jgi:hypothetical protein
MATGMLLFAGRTVTKLSSMIFVAVLQNCPMRTKYVFDIVIIGNVAMATEMLLFAGRTVIKLSSMIFVVVLQNCPMRPKYLFDIVPIGCFIFECKMYKYKLILKCHITIRIVLHKFWGCIKFLDGFMWTYVDRHINHDL